MSHFIINGGCPLTGRVHVQGSKNAALPLMAAAVLNKGITVLHNIPQILDVYYMMQILEAIGCKIIFRTGTMEIDARWIDCDSIPEKWTEKMRSGVMLLSPLLVRCGSVSMGQPGGCSIGKRPVDLHLAALRQLGAEVEEQESLLILKSNGLRGCRIRLPYPSVGATENILMAACGAEGVTILENPAREPEIFQLCKMLRKLGSCIEMNRAGNFVIWGGYQHQNIVLKNCGDRIVAATWLSAVAVAGGQIELTGISPRHMEEVLKIFKKMGCNLWIDNGKMCVTRLSRLYPLKGIETGPYPAFPTDVQSLIMAVMAGVDGISSIQENVFEARFQTANELRKMGADIEIEGRKAQIFGKQNLQAARMQAPDLRGGAALVVASLGVKGCSIVEKAEHVLRGYENFAQQLCQLGADVSLVEHDVL
ncbi:MAG: UDP-N-acetylglucosamine 1-carboxyvinyltransferase [Lachnospiraceae bacterium]